MKNRADLQILDVLHERLKRDGFERHGWLWNKRTEATIDVIDVQKSKATTRDEGSMTVNVGIALPDVYSILWHKEPPSFIKEPDCMLRRRIGRLVGSGDHANRRKDLWWDFDANTNAKELGAQIVELIVSNAYPWQNALRSHRAVAECLRNSTDVFDSMAPARISLCILDTLLDGILRMDAFEELKAKFPPWSSSIDMAVDELRRRGPPPPGLAAGTP
jgi:hypothetical protein